MDKTIENSDNQASPILGTKISITSYEEASEKIIKLAQNKKSSAVYIANVHLLLEAYYNKQLREAINSAELVTPDGMPLVWGLSLSTKRNAKRVCGPDLAPIVCRKAEQQNISIGFYGSTEETLRLLKGKIKERFPLLNMVYAFSPPFRALTKAEDERIVSEINSSGARIIFVGLGCPKQEEWLATHKNKVSAVMISIGAAFDFIAGTRKRAPMWIQNLGLEWLYRFIQEPGRLWKRYLIGNPVFFWLLLKEIIFKRSCAGEKESKILC